MAREATIYVLVRADGKMVAASYDAAYVMRAADGVEDATVRVIRIDLDEIAEEIRRWRVPLGSTIEPRAMA